jgi:hypothetical protein
MEAVCSTARLSGMPAAVHTGAAQACKQAIRCGARSLEHAYLIDEEAIGMATRGGVYIVPTMQMTQEDLGGLRAGTLPCQAVWKFSRDSQRIVDAQRLVASRDVTKKNAGNQTAGSRFRSSRRCWCRLATDPLSKHAPGRGCSCPA